MPMISQGMDLPKPCANGPITLQCFSQRMSMYEKLMQNVSIRFKIERKKSEKALP